MRLKIKISEQLNENINKKTEMIKVEIHSIFQNSINFLYEDRMYVLQPMGFYKTPLSCILELDLENFNLLKKQINHRFILSYEKFYIGEFIFDTLILNKNLKINKINEIENLRIFYNFLEKKLLTQKFSGVLFNAFIYLKNKNRKLTALEKYFLEKLELIFSKNFKIQDFEYFLGAGEGLTPSGDDFICGYLASLFFLGKFEVIKQIKNILEPQLHKTTRVSEEYLYYALMGRFNEYVFNLNELCNKKRLGNLLTEIDKEIVNIKKIGHSSGTDFLIGLYCGLVREGKW